MQLTDKLFEDYKNGNEKYVDLGKGYVMLCKSMPVEDQRLDWFIEAINKAKEEGIKVTGIYDYRLITSAIDSYSNGGITYSKGLFIEDKAKGTSITYKIFSPKEGFTTEEFLNLEEEYVSELERRAKADDSIFDKLVSDYKMLGTYGLTPDSKPTNFFFSEEGFTIVDVITKSKANEEPYLPNYIFGAVFGYGLPFINDPSKKKNDILTEELKERYENVYVMLTEKVVKALKKNEVKEEYIDKELTKREKARKGGIKVLEGEELNTYITSLVNRYKK